MEQKRNIDFNAMNDQSNMIWRTALDRDLQSIQSLLKLSGLPFEDCAEHLKNFIVLEKDNKMIGVGGLENYGEVALLRSIAVLSSYQGRGFGHELYNQLRSKALEHGVKQLFVLTQTAEHYFTRRGFVPISRITVPERIKQTKQFTSLCPSSAVVLCCNI